MSTTEERRHYVELLRDHDGMALTNDERSDWEAAFAQQRELEAAGAPYGRCTNENYDIGRLDEHPPCGAVLLPSTDGKSTWCVACTWRDVRDYGSDG